MSRKKNKNSLSTFVNTILAIFGEHPFKPMNYKQIAKMMSVRDAADKDVIHQILVTLCNEGKLIEDRPYRYLLHPDYIREYGPKPQYVVGIVDMKSTGKAYVIPDEEGEDIFIAANNTGKALHGDKVKVSMFPKRKSKKNEGEIVEIIERAKTDFVGIFSLSHGFAFVVPDRITMPLSIYIPKGKYKGAKDGQKVIVHLTDWPDNAKNPFGEIVKVLGNPGENNVEMQSILAEYEYPLDFPKAVEKEAKAISEKIKSAEIKKRRDFRNVFTVTIDPHDAKDFDDALSLQYLPNGNYEVGVHIADVSHYVQPGSAIDAEAQERGTSVYLVDRTIPMLPEKLCNMVCSLRPDEEKLAFSVIFELNENADIVNKWIGKTVIKSNRRYAYEEVQEMIEGADGDNKKELMTLNDLATKLRAKRMKEGCINFHSEEVKFILDENGKPIDTYVKVQKEANMLIEDFMLLANKTIAETMSKSSKYKDYTFVFRIHDEPNPEKLSNFIQLVSKLGYSMNISSREKLVKSYNALFDAVDGKGEKNLVESVAIRTMAKAVYSTTNIGHYGLAFPYYTHFTSPIRRYPDLMVHRLIERYLIENQPSVDKEEYEELCLHASEMEKRAADMERESVKYKQAEYLQDQIGKVFDGLISGISKWGIYVELKKSKCEGLIRYADLDDDFYYLDEENFRVIGQDYGNIYQLGDEVKIRVKDVNLIKKQLDFEMVVNNRTKKRKR
ncbi:MAG: ribonuclease R [Lentimicrobiaceae bacterium]|nr:ribonuclease R [Lentimicrobiaceae bacterium]